jgi:leader peptidase (prepilin peptidase)/N-methyltransferase
MLVLAYFGVIFIIDVEHRLVLHPTTLAGAVLGLIYGWSQHGIMNSIAGGLIGFTIMAMIYYLGVVYIKIVSRKRGRSTSEVALGFGDVNLALVCGLFLGWPEIVIGLLCAILMGGIVSALMILFMIITKRYRPYFAIPYAPFIILGTIILLFR